MCKFEVGDEVIFSDPTYAKRTGAMHKLGEQATVIGISHNGEGYLVTVRFAKYSVMEAFDYRFSFADGMNKTAVERKIAFMYTRQPYYKTIKGNKSCVA